MAKKQVQIVQDPEAPVEKTVLAKAILDINVAATALKKSGLNRRAIVVLVSHSSKQPQYVVSNVLDGLEQLKRDYCA